MKDKFFLFVFLFFIIISVILINAKITGRIIGTENPEEVIGNLYKSIGIAEKNGDYRCCIEPPCTMCYLGKWKFDKGTCYCDDAIAEGREEDVCPECKKGLEEGTCESSREICEI